MDYRDKYKFTKNLLIITIIGFIVSLYYAFEIMHQSRTIILEKPKVELINTDSFSEQNLLNFIISLDIKNPNIVLNQAKLETGNFTSDRFKKYNALFGFQTSDIQIVKYNSWKESVIHYKTWQMFRLKDSENYYDFLKRVNYASDTNYIKKLKQFKDA